MKTFKILENGDLSIKNNDIEMVSSDEEVIKQGVTTVLSTQKGEWFLNLQYGINQYNLLGKNVTDDMVRSEIQNGLIQIDPTFVITNLVVDRNNSERKLLITFEATNEAGYILHERRELNA